ncbi:hypothetical protein A4U64_23710 [Rhodococcus sp. WB1]|nr:hypothetical protein A4U64_23710 [Rhodococcus sp. WB1]KDE10367.1 hypothetical protein N505_0125770 [Rhodococcus aetherivorans]
MPICSRSTTCGTAASSASPRTAHPAPSTDTATRTGTGWNRPRHAQPASTAAAAAEQASTVIMTRRRSKRSTIQPAGTVAAVKAPIVTVETSPTVAAEPLTASTHNMIATP